MGGQWFSGCFWDRGLDLAGGAMGGGVVGGGDVADDHADGELVVFELQGAGCAVGVCGAADVPAELVQAAVCFGAVGVVGEVAAGCPCVQVLDGDLVAEQLLAQLLGGRGLVGFAVGVGGDDALGVLAELPDGVAQRGVDVDGFYGGGARPVKVAVAAFVVLFDAEPSCGGEGLGLFSGLPLGWGGVAGAGGEQEGEGEGGEGFDGVFHGGVFWDEAV